ncbi:MAG: four helix bundle protein, partial [Candidatus Gracilibacteria bacterium]|nr:four helix bundle protein [Candidatus Gracilibacteria bacterium]
MESNYQKLIVWQKAMQLVTCVYQLTEDFPKIEVYGITNQMRRSAVSIPSNIAEGSQRRTNKDFIYFLRNSKASSAELETQLFIAENIKYLKNFELYKQFHAFILEIRKMLSALESKLTP